jgi:uncharacterized alkaline shock family protein YloU
LADDLQTARAAAEAALATEGVHSLGAGRYVEAATYGAGEKVSGVVVGPDTVEVHVRVPYPLPKPIPEIAEQVRQRVAPRAGGRKTTVVVEDLAMVEENQPGGGG